jgi:EmrB/QacA subfamily drug resistance transporter
MPENPDVSSYSGLTRRQVVWTIVGLQITLLLAALDQTIVSTAMPKIIAELNGFERYAWVTTAYLLSSTATLPVFGRLSDMYGRKWLMLFGAALFVVASALCGAAGHLPIPGDGMTQLIICRGLQGIAGGAIMSLVFTVLGDLFSPAERGKYQGLFSAVWALASVLGPVVGGGLTDHLSWRWVFYVNLPVGAVALCVLYFAFPAKIKDHGQPRKHAIDVLGVVTLVAWVVPLMLGLTWAPDDGITSTKVILSFAASLIFFVLFIFAELRHAEPMVPLTLFRNSVIAVSCLSLLLVGVAMFGAILFVPLYFQAVMGASASMSGYMMIPMMLMITIGSVVSGQLISRTGKYKWVALLGLGTLAAGNFLFSQSSVATPLAVSISYLAILGIGLGFLMPVYTVAGQNAVEQRMIGVATGVTQFFRSIGGTLGAAVFNSLMLLHYESFLSKAAGYPVHAPNPIAHGATEATKEALVYALDNIFLVAALLMVGAFIINFFLRELPLKKEPENVPAAPADPEIVVQ